MATRDHLHDVHHAGARFRIDDDRRDTEPRLARGTQKRLKLDRAEVQQWAAELAPPTDLELDFDIEALADAVMIVHASGRIGAVNDGAVELFGYSRDEIIGRPAELLVARPGHAESRPAAGEPHVRFVTASRRAVAYHRDGRDIPVEILLCPSTRDSIVAVLRRTGTSARAALREQDVADIVHDLKHPLATIALEASVLEALLGSSHEVTAALGRIGQNLAFMDRMVHDLLDVASLDAGGLALVRQPTELRALLAEVIDRVISSRDRGRVHLDADDAVLANIDDSRIERVIANLIQNALKYSPPRSHVVVKLQYRADVACISVIDAGPGLSPDEADFVFDKFRRTRSGRKHDGAGLGLFVSRKIVEAHGGRIGVDSTLARGSRFFFELPLDPP